MQNDDVKSRLEAIEKNARQVLAEKKSEIEVRDEKYYKRCVVVPPEPIFIRNVEDIGTVRARANHPDAYIDFFTEQEKLKKAGAPM